MFAGIRQRWWVFGRRNNESASPAIRAIQRSLGGTSAVVIVAAFDVVFAEIVAHPGFDDDQGLLAAVGYAMPLTDLDDDLRAAFERDRFSAVAAEDDLALPLDDQPVFFAARVALKAGALAGQDHEAFGAPAGAFAQDFEAAPGTLFGSAGHGAKYERKIRNGEW
jgi:hypothetical protein